jgi:putative transposase
MQVAVNYYLNQGRNISRTIRSVGYPSKHTLKEWIDKLAPSERKIRIKRRTTVQYSQEHKKDAVIELCTREGSASVVIDKFGASRYSLYKWKKELLGEEGVKTMDRSNKRSLPDDRDALLAEVESLKKEIYRKQMEPVILKKAAEIIKKDPGINPRKLTSREKATLIDALRTEYPLNNLLKMICMPKSSYFYQKKRRYSLTNILLYEQR